MKPFLIGSLLFLFTAVAFGQTTPSTKALAGNPVHQKNCAKCHGKTAEGRFMGGPSLVSADATAMPREDLINTVRNGKHRMPKYAGKLTPEEITTLVDEIKSAASK